MDTALNNLRRYPLSMKKQLFYANSPLHYTELTVTKISNVLETGFYICFHTKNKWQFDYYHLFLHLLFFRVTPTIDKEPYFFRVTPTIDKEPKKISIKKQSTEIWGLLAPPTGLEPVTSWLTVMRSTDWAMEEYLKVGISLFSRGAAAQVFSAPLSLTSVFGMGTGVPST